MARRCGIQKVQKHSNVGRQWNCRRKKEEAEQPSSLDSQKIVHINSSFAENGPQRSLRHVARMMRDRNFPSGLRMAPDLMTACTCAVEAKSERTKASCNFTVAKSRKAPHQGIMTGTRNSRAGTCPSRKAAGNGSPCSRQDSTIFRARLCAISMVSDRLRPSATSPGTSGLVPKNRPPFRDCTRTRMATSSTFARCTCRFTGPSGMRDDYIKPRAAARDVVSAEHIAREKKTDWDGPAGNGNRG